MLAASRRMFIDGQWVSSSDGRTRDIISPHTGAVMATAQEGTAEDANRAVEALKKKFAQEKLDTQDGIRVDWQKSWIHARPSNTEPLMRIIAEAHFGATALVSL